MSKIIKRLKSRYDKSLKDFELTREELVRENGITKSLTSWTQLEGVMEENGAPEVMQFKCRVKEGMGLNYKIDYSIINTDCLIRERDLKEKDYKKNKL